MKCTFELENKKYPHFYNIRNDKNLVQRMCLSQALEVHTGCVSIY
jgi:hypothetical protein